MTPKSYLWDMTAGGGVGLIAAGLWWIYPPACLIVLGLIATCAGLIGAKLHAPQPQGERETTGG